jgi:hypothetical protein
LNEKQLFLKLPSLRIIARALYINEVEALEKILNLFDKIRNRDLIFEYFNDLQKTIEELKPDIVYIKSLIYFGIILSKLAKNVSIENQFEKISLSDSNV